MCVGTCSRVRVRVVLIALAVVVTLCLLLPKNRVRHVFRQWDANDDGSLDLNEFKVRL